MNLGKLLDRLKVAEGFRAERYRDSLGFWTIGYGRLIDGRRGAGLSNSEAAIMLSRNWAFLVDGVFKVTEEGGEYLLTKSVSQMLTELAIRLPWWERLDDVRQRVIAEMAYQIGIQGLLAFHTTLGHMERGEVDQAADQMLLSRWARQTPGRAHRLSETYRTGKDEA